MWGAYFMWDTRRSLKVIEMEGKWAKQTRRFKGRWSKGEYRIQHICFVSSHLSPLLPARLSSSSLSAAVKMDASPWRQRTARRSHSPAVAASSLQPFLPKSLPPSPAPLSPFTRVKICPHRSFQTQIQPQPAWRTGPVNSPCKQGKKSRAER